MGCEGVCVHSHVQCVVAHVRVHAKRLLNYVCDVFCALLSWSHTTHATTLDNLNI